HDRAPVPDQGDYDPAPLRMSHPQVVQRTSGEGRIRSDVSADQHQFSAGELHDFGDAGLANEREQFFGGGGSGVYDDVDPQLVDAFAELRLFDPGDRALGAQLVGCVTGQDVGAVAVRHGDQKIGVGGSGLLQGLDGGTVGYDHQSVQLLLDLSRERLVGLDEVDVLTFAGEERGEIRADGAG